jgi:serine protease Do
VSAVPARSIAASTDRVSLETGFAPIVKRSLPAVVNISSSKMIHAKGNEGTSSQPSAGSAPQSAGNQVTSGSHGPRDEREENLGSGVIISPDGYILTNAHLVDGGHIKVAFVNQRECEARIVGKDDETDIAVLKVDAEGLPAMPLGDSSKMEPGDFVLAIGDPFGLGPTVTVGIVSAVGRGNLGIEDYEDFIQTDAAINPGNSGGALINSGGQLIGINTAILSGAGGSQGVGFAIPINLAREVMDQLVKNGRVIRGWLGVTVQPVTPAIAKAFGLSGLPRGALVAAVNPDSPAARAGLTVGDIILAMNTKRLPDSRALSLNVAMMEPGSALRLEILRGGTVREIPATLDQEPRRAHKAEELESSSADRSAVPAALLDGISVVELTPDIARHLHLAPTTQGLVVTDVDSASMAAAAGLGLGDVIQQVDRKPVANLPDFQHAARFADKSRVLLLVNQGGNARFLVVEPE